VFGPKYKKTDNGQHKK